MKIFANFPSTNSSRVIVPVILCSMILLSCKGKTGSEPGYQTVSDSLTEEQQHLPENALKGLDIAEGLEVIPVASEPMLKNPTNMDVDDRGRIWITEAYNYRPAINGNPTNPAGDRIVIIEDLNGDGRADTSKVFYQGPEINAPLGISVMGNRVIVSQSPYVWNFYDDNGDDKADRKEILFQGIGGEQHDHGAHSFTFGPDGKLYFNFGNEGKTLKDKNGKTVRDQDGDEIGPGKYKMGMVFRCNPDGSAVECLGNNFRNNYEVAVDSYGTLWQSDNDDDGNRGVRINYVMQYGNYGYTDEMTGASWSANRTNIEDSIPYRHWHLNDPGVVPNVLQTGSGSPTGMVVYEGSLLPQRFINQMIHCDAGPNVVRSYPVKNAGAGYSATINNVLNGSRDQWFRPADVCVAPDGTLLVADWYDPGVGGHQAGDQQRGRVYRVQPKGYKYQPVTIAYTTPADAVAALQNPNLVVRYKAFTALVNMKASAIAPLEQLWRGGKNGRMAARAFWVLLKVGTNPSSYINEAIASTNADTRIMGIRAAKEYQLNLVPSLQKLSDDTSMQVLRECALVLHHVKDPAAASIWTKLATHYDGSDRWYLEALGIAADGQWDTFLAEYTRHVPDPLKNPAGRDIIWRARGEVAVPFLSALAADQSVPVNQRLRYFRAFDFHNGPAKKQYLLGMIENSQLASADMNPYILRALDVQSVSGSAKARAALDALLKATYGTSDYLEMVKRYQRTTEQDNLLKMALKEHDNELGKSATSLLLQFGGDLKIRNVINSGDTASVNHALQALSEVGTKPSLSILESVMGSGKYADDTRKLAAGYIGKSWSGEERVVELLKAKKVPATYIPAIVASVDQAWRGEIRSQAASFLPNAGAAATRKDPTIKELASLKANAANGQLVFVNKCGLCHVAGNKGNDFGPKLTEIGSKLPKDGLLDAILHPSAGISFGYEGWEYKMKDGSTYTGIVASKTETDIDMKFPGGSKQSFKTSAVASQKELKESMMPAGLHNNMSNQELADLLEYLEGLKKRG